MKKEEKEFIEEEKEEDTECQLEKKQLEERLSSCNNSVSNLENQNQNLSSSGEACRKQLAGMMRFKELSENCLKDMERQHAREKDHQRPAAQQSSLDQVQSELRKCREDLRERLKVKIEQTEKLHTDLNNCEKLHTDLNNCEVTLNVTTKKELEKNDKINRDLSQCKESLQQYQGTNVSKCEEQTKTIEIRCNALETELKEIKVKCETCQSSRQRENSTENSQTGRDAEIGGYSYIMQILYKYGLL